MNVYSAAWCLRYLKPSRLVSLAIIIGFAILALSFPTAHPLEDAIGGGIGRAWLWFGSFCLGAGLVLFSVLLIADILRLGLKATGFNVPVKIYAYCALAIAASLVGAAVIKGAGPPLVKRMDIALNGLPGKLDGFKIVQISDFHLGRLTGPDKLRRLTAQVNLLEPDLVAFTGDILERRGVIPGDICEILGALRFRYGTVAVLGNHDLFAGKDAAGNLFTSCGVKVLRGEVYEPVPGLIVGGVDDLKRAPISAKNTAVLAKKLYAPGKATILLSHQPQGWEPLTGGRPALVLSGHSHAGQIFPFNMIERPFFKYFYGLYRDRETVLYVTSGAGTWGPPMRLGTDSELPLIVLRAVTAK
jgi:predicted MPP superfamily phosphohydrolase